MTDENWQEQLGDELRENETLARYKTLDDFAKGHLETKALVSQSLRVPPAEAGDEARANFLTKLVETAPELTLKPTEDNIQDFYKVMGRPDEAGGYEVPEGIELEEAVVGEIREMAHSTHLTQDQFGLWMKEMNTRHDRATEIYAEQQEESVEGLKAEWGGSFDQRMEIAEKINTELYPGVPFDQLTPDEIRGRFGTNERLTGKIQVAAQVSEDPLKLSPDEALRRAAEIQTNPDYWDKSSPNQRHLIKKHGELLLEAGFSTDSRGLTTSVF